MNAALTTNELTFTYPRAREPVISDWTGSFNGGTMTALVGASGSGKSTLLFLLGLMMKPTSGTITVQGIDATASHDSHRSHLRAHRYGFIFQDACLDPRRSVISNILQPATLRGTSHKSLRSHAEEMMQEMGVTVPPQRHPGQISGGQAQRIALCRALLHDPPIILADEPTGNLDPASADVVVAELRRRADAGACVLIVTHTPTVAEACDETIELG